MSDQEKREQEIMNQEMSTDEMETVAGGWGLKMCESTVEGGLQSCFYGSFGSKCEIGTALKYGRPIHRPDGTMNCAATVEDGSHCGSNDACYSDEVVYLGMKECSKAWK